MRTDYGRCAERYDVIQELFIARLNDESVLADDKLLEHMDAAFDIVF